MKYVEDICAELRVHIARKYKTQKTAAQAWGVSDAFVSAVLGGQKKPSSVMLEDAGFERISEGVKYKRVKEKKQNGRQQEAS